MTNSDYLSYYQSNVEKNNLKDLLSTQTDNIYSLSHLSKNLGNTYKKVICINPGPSLESKMDEIMSTYLDEVKRAETLFICSDVSLQGLLLKGLVPDIVVTLDISEKTASFLTGVSSLLTIVAPTASAIHLYYNPNHTYYLYNSLEEDSHYTFQRTDTIMSDPKQLEAYNQAVAKSEEVLSILKEASIYSRFPGLAARGSVVVTLYQLIGFLKIDTDIYGSDFAVRYNRPYADFISEGNVKHFHAISLYKDLSLEQYTEKIFSGYFMNSITEEDLTAMQNSPGSYFSTPLLDFYRSRLFEYANACPLPRYLKVEFL